MTIDCFTLKGTADEIELDFVAGKRENILLKF
jgi:hypothetical protein